MPRRTLRTQLTLLYAGPFLVSSALLLTIPILGTRQSQRADPPNGYAPGPIGGVVESGTPGGTDLRHLLTLSTLGLAAAVVVSLVLGWLIAGRFLRPLRTIIATARDISASNLDRRLGRTGRDDEFTELAATLDDLFARLGASFTSQRNFVANASHELRTPLTAERALLQVALADPNASVDTLRSACRDVLSLSAAQERLIEALLTLASGEQGVEHREPIDLAAITGDVVLARTEQAHQRHIRVNTALESAPTTGDPRLIESLVTNLVDNALRHNTAGGSVEITTSTTQNQARLTVRNTGTPIPPDQVERLFEPFQQLSTQRIRHTNGHGLGLAIVRAIANAHHATLTAQSQPTGGLHIEITFP